MSLLPQEPHSANSRWLCRMWSCVRSSVTCWPLRRSFSPGSGRPPALPLMKIWYTETHVVFCDFRASGTGSLGNRCVVSGEPSVPPKSLESVGMGSRDKGKPGALREPTPPRASQGDGGGQRGMEAEEPESLLKMQSCDLGPGSPWQEGDTKLLVKSAVRGLTPRAYPHRTPSRQGDEEAPTWTGAEPWRRLPFRGGANLTVSLMCLKREGWAEGTAGGPISGASAVKTDCISAEATRRLNNQERSITSPGSQHSWGPREVSSLCRPPCLG